MTQSSSLYTLRQASRRSWRIGQRAARASEISLLRSHDADSLSASHGKETSGGAHQEGKFAGLPLGQILIIGDACCCDGRLFFLGFHGRLEAADALSDSFAQLGQLLGTEYKQSNSEDNQQMHRLKQSFKHTSLLESR